MVCNSDENQNWIEKPRWRFLILVVSAVAGVFVYFYGVPLVECWLGVEIDDPLRQLPATLPTLCVLWFVRTYDTRQQIAKVKEQIAKAEEQIERTNMQTQQSNFADGARFLAANNALEISIGVKILSEVSKKTDEFDSQIRLAFAKRLERLPDGVALDKHRTISINDRRIPHTRAMLLWISQYHKEGDDISIFPNFHYKEFLHRSDWKVGEANTERSIYLCSINKSELKYLFKASVSSDNIWLR